MPVKKAVYVVMATIRIYTRRSGADSKLKANMINPDMRVELHIPVPLVHIPAPHLPFVIDRARALPTFNSLAWERVSSSPIFLTDFLKLVIGWRNIKVLLVDEPTEPTRFVSARGSRLCPGD